MGPLKVELVWGCVHWCRSWVMPWSITSESLWLYMLYPCVWPQASLTPFSVCFPIFFFSSPPTLPYFPSPQRSTQPPRWLPLARHCPSHPRSSSSSSREKVRVREHYYFYTSHTHTLILRNRHVRRWERETSNVFTSFWVIPICRQKRNITSVHTSCSIKNRLNCVSCRY